MKILFLHISLFLLFVTLLYPADKTNKEKKSADTENIVIARVAGRDITYSDFVARSEYTFRPVYCLGNTNNDKNIILNSLIAEKIFALENEKKGGPVNKDFLSMIEGRKEQKMREMLYREEGLNKVLVDRKETEKYFELSGRTYKIQYLNLNNRGDAEAAAYQLKLASDTLSGKILPEEPNSKTEIDSIPEREVSWFSPENELIIKALFSDKLKKGEIVGPVTLNDTTNLILIVKGWTDEVAVTSNDIKLRWSNVTEKLATVKADSIYDKFVLNIMGSKKLHFSPEIFNKLAELFAPFYVTRMNKNNTENDFLNLIYMNDIEIPDPEAFESSYESLKNKLLLSIDGKDWTVNDLKYEIDRHPLIFRRTNYKDSFAEQLKFAIADLVRDKYLTDEAYNRGYGKDDAVKHYTQMWKDAGLALVEREEYLVNKGFTGEFTIKDFDEYLNPYIKTLLKKYSENIEINVDEYNKIKLTRTNMYTTQPDVPYKIYVPTFPHLTTYNRLDYGTKMNVQ